MRKVMEMIEPSGNEFPACDSDNEQELRRKLLIMALCEALPGIRREELARLALDSLFLDYFQWSSALDELVETGLIHIATRKEESQRDAHGKHASRCGLTPKGCDALATLKSTLPDHILTYIEQQRQSAAPMLTAELDVHATYQPDGSGGYRVMLSRSFRQKEQLALTLAVPTESEAKTFCNLWESRSVDVYDAIYRIFFPE